MSPTFDGFDLDHEADVVRLYLSTWWHNSLGVECDVSTRVRALKALERLEAAARKEAA